MFVITDSLVPFVRELLGGMSQGPAQSPCNSSRCLMGFSLFSVALTRVCCPGIRDEWQSSAELSADEHVMKRQVLKSLQTIVGGQSSWYKHYTFSGLIVFLGGGVCFSKPEVSWHLAKAKRAILFSSFWLDTGAMAYQSAGLFFCTED